MRAEASAADHIHAHFTHWPASAAVMASLLTGTPCSFTAHARDIFCTNPDALRRKVERSRFAVTVSEHTREALAVAAPAHAHAIQVVRNGVDLSRYRPRRAGGASDPLVLTVARLVDKKGVDVVVEACARSAAAASWLVIGEGPRRAALERRSAEACAGRVGFTGAAGAGEVAAALARATVFALPCRVASDGDRDALPVALVEAMAAGLPVVTTAVGGIPELVRDGESGLLVPPDDPDALAVAIDRLLGDPGLREQLGSGALADVAGYDLPGCIADLRGRMAA